MSAPYLLDKSNAYLEPSRAIRRGPRCLCFKGPGEFIRLRPDSRNGAVGHMTLNPAILTIRYTLFAVVATSVNLGTQYVSLAAYSGANALFATLLLGTGIGLGTKYFLDRRWIFFEHRDIVY